MASQLDEPDDEGLSEDEWRRIARFDDAFTEYAERESRRLTEAFAPLIEAYNARFRDAFAPLIEYNTAFGGISCRIAEAMSLTANFPSPVVAAAQDALQRFAEYSTFNSTIQTLAETVGQHFQSQWQGLFESLGNIAARIFPENWEGVDTPSIEDLELILIDEGIPLMWVPGPKAVEALINADNASARRRIIGSRWKGIVSDCETVLEEVDHPKLLSERDFALDCVDALRDGHTNPAQSLAANLLDTVLSHLDKDTRKLLTKNNFKQGGDKFSLDDYKFRAALTFAPVWCAHAKFWVDKGDSIPRTFGRHPSVHAVSRAQYSRINAVIGLMVVTSVLKFFDTQMSS
ncbi:hypothetical protein [Streptomyces sp. T028]|uniref:hypothetical protein n=1 Tax=Streptomyces sp. T028 TaxID=3394379 RepID=UPI003A8AC08A